MNQKQQPNLYINEISKKEISFYRKQTKYIDLFEPINDQDETYLQNNVNLHISEQMNLDFIPQQNVNDYKKNQNKQEELNEFNLNLNENRIKNSKNNLNDENNEEDILKQIKNKKSTKSNKQFETRDNVKLRMVNLIKGMAKNLNMNVKNGFCQNLVKYTYNKSESAIMSNKNFMQSIIKKQPIQQKSVLQKPVLRADNIDKNQHKFRSLNEIFLDNYNEELDSNNKLYNQKQYINQHFIKLSKLSEMKYNIIDRSWYQVKKNLINYQEQSQSEQHRYIINCYKNGHFGKWMNMIFTETSAYNNALVKNILNKKAGFKSHLNDNNMMKYVGTDYLFQKMDINDQNAWKEFLMRVGDGENFLTAQSDTQSLTDITVIQDCSAKCKLDNYLYTNDIVQAISIQKLLMITQNIKHYLTVKVQDRLTHLDNVLNKFSTLQRTDDMIMNAYCEQVNIALQHKISTKRDDELRIAAKQVSDGLVQFDGIMKMSQPSLIKFKAELMQQRTIIDFIVQINGRFDVTKSINHAVFNQKNITDLKGLVKDHNVSLKSEDLNCLNQIEFALVNKNPDQFKDLINSNNTESLTENQDLILELNRVVVEHGEIEQDPKNYKNEHQQISIILQGYQYKYRKNIIYAFKIIRNTLIYILKNDIYLKASQFNHMISVAIKLSFKVSCQTQGWCEHKKFCKNQQQCNLIQMMSFLSYVYGSDNLKYLQYRDRKWEIQYLQEFGNAFSKGNFINHLFTAVRSLEIVVQKTDEYLLKAKSLQKIANLFAKVGQVQAALTFLYQAIIIIDKKFQKNQSVYQSIEKQIKSMEQEIHVVKQNILGMQIYRNAKSGSIIDNLKSLQTFFTNEMYYQKYNNNEFIEKCLSQMSNDIDVYDQMFNLLCNNQNKYEPWVIITYNLYLEIQEKSTFKYKFYECDNENNTMRLIKILKSVVKVLLNQSSILDENYGMYYGLDIKHMLYIMKKDNYVVQYPSELIKIIQFKVYREIYWPISLLFSKNLIFNDMFCPHQIYQWLFKMMTELIMHFDNLSQMNQLKKNLNDITKNIRSITRQSNYVNNGVKFKYNKQDVEVDSNGTETVEQFNVNFTQFTYLIPEYDIVIKIANFCLMSDMLSKSTKINVQFLLSILSMIDLMKMEDENENARQERLRRCMTHYMCYKQMKASYGDTKIENKYKNKSQQVSLEYWYGNMKNNIDLPPDWRKDKDKASFDKDIEIQYRGNLKDISIQYNNNDYDDNTNKEMRMNKLKEYNIISESIYSENGTNYNMIKELNWGFVVEMQKQLKKDDDV